MQELQELDDRAALLVSELFTVCAPLFYKISSLSKSIARLN
jgi:hypothetical protein